MTKRQEILCIIPARGGSKGIPDKNLYKVAGKPLIAHTIEQALATAAVKRVVVSTDDSRIAGTAKQYGAEIIRRPKNISGPKATSESALLHALVALKKNEHYEPQIVLFLQATSPLRESGDIQEAIETLAREKADSLFSYTRTHSFVWRKRGHRWQDYTYDYKKRPRRQDAPLDVMENGSIYIFKPWVLRKFKNRLGGKIAGYEMSLRTSFQIDTQEDSDLIEKLMFFDQTHPQTKGFKRVKLLVSDFDGVMTNNRVRVQKKGKESVVCHRGDGLGISLLKKNRVKVFVLSTEENSVVGARCRKLKIPFLQGCKDKLRILKRVTKQYDFHRKQVAYIGNDINDLDCMKWVGVPIAVADAVPEIIKIARVVTRAKGGQGAVREVCDFIRSSKSKGNKS